MSDACVHVCTCQAGLGWAGLVSMLAGELIEDQAVHVLQPCNCELGPLPAPPLSSAGYLLTVPSPVDGMCSVGCGCDSTTYTPVCDGSTGLTHFSPCHAGCVNLTEVHKSAGESVRSCDI